tara:strand:- start:134 stop:370 length:237 start_codon:yes stop_codon:yes gene_type:complete
MNDTNKNDREKLLNRAERIHYNEKIISLGLGDSVAKVIKKATGGLVKPCNSCEKRREKLNQMFPYKKNTGCKKCDEKK